MKKRKRGVRKNFYYTVVFLTPDGRIYVDFSSRNKENQIVFRRIIANDIVDD